MTDSTERASGGPDSAERGEDPPDGDFYRGGGAVATRPTVLSLPRIGSLDGARPPAWAFYPLFLVGVLGGLFVFSATRELLGDGVYPLLVAVLIALAVLAGPGLVGGLLWSRATSGSPGEDAR